MRRPMEKPMGGKPMLVERVIHMPKELGRLLKKQYLAQRVQRQPEERPEEYATDRVENTAGGAAGYTVDATTRSIQHVWQERKQEAKRRRNGERHTDAAPEYGYRPESEEPAAASTGEVHHEVEYLGRGEEAPAGHAPKEKTKEHMTIDRPADRIMAGQEQRKSSTPKDRKKELVAAKRPLDCASAPRERVCTAAPKERKRPTTPAKTQANRSTAAHATQKTMAQFRQHLKRKVAKSAAVKTAQPPQVAARAGAKSAAKLTAKLGRAAIRAVTAMVSALAGLLGGGVLLVVILVVGIIGALAASPFGILLAGQNPAPGAVSVAEAVGQVNSAFSTYLNDLQADTEHDRVVLHGSTADWREVLTVFAVKTSLYDGESAADVATLDVDKQERLKAVFWDMNAIHTELEAIDHPGNGPEDSGWTEYVLHLFVESKTADDMSVAYGFNGQQAEALDELLEEHSLLGELATDLTITDPTAREVLRNLPVDLSRSRRAAVETTLSLVGKVPYFWGGKSGAIGWDDRWGQLRLVSDPGSSTSGGYLPYGLDCTGFLDWTFRNAGLHSDGHWYIGSNLTELSWDDALPGDIALFPDASHVGLVVGRSTDGGILVCHCANSKNNVVVTDCAATDFTVIGRPDVFDLKPLDSELTGQPAEPLLRVALRALSYEHFNNHLLTDSTYILSQWFLGLNHNPTGDNWCAFANWLN